MARRLASTFDEWTLRSDAEHSGLSTPRTKQLQQRSVISITPFMPAERDGGGERPPFALCWNGVEPPD